MCMMHIFFTDKELSVNDWEYHIQGQLAINQHRNINLWDKRQSHALLFTISKLEGNFITVRAAQLSKCIQTWSIILAEK